MAEEVKKNRNIFITKDIDTDSVMPAIQQIIGWNEEDDQREKTVKDYIREPINIFLSTPGGAAYAGNALRDIIVWSKTPVHTIALGACMSAGLLVFVVGHKRYVTERATLMFHGVASSVCDKLPAQEINLAEGKRLQENYITDIFERSKIPKETMEKWVEGSKDWYIDAAEAITLGLADEYYK